MSALMFRSSTAPAQREAFVAGEEECRRGPLGCAARAHPTVKAFPHSLTQAAMVWISRLGLFSSAVENLQVRNAAVSPLAAHERATLPAAAFLESSNLRARSPVPCAKPSAPECCSFATGRLPAASDAATTRRMSRIIRKLPLTRIMCPVAPARC